MMGECQSITSIQEHNIATFLSISGSLCIRNQNGLLSTQNKVLGAIHVSVWNSYIKVEILEEIWYWLLRLV